jgi:hypothetical protein
LDQPLSARITQGSAAIDPGSIRFMLRDLATGAVSVMDAATFTGGVAQTTPVRLTPEHTYSMRVTAADIDGNVSVTDQGTALSQGFRAISASGDDATATLVTSTATPRAPLDLATGVRTLSFDHVQLSVAAGAVDLSSTRHGGYGYVQLRVPLNSAQVCPPQGALDSCRSAYDPSDPAWSARSVALQFSTLTINSEVPVHIAIAPADALDLGTLTARVPASWPSATLQMKPVRLPTSFPTCASPLGAGAFPACGPDPLRFFISDRGTAMLSAEQQRLKTGMNAPVSGYPGAEVHFQYMYVRVGAGQMYRVVPIPTNPTVTTGLAVNTDAAPVAYPTSYPVVYPGQYQTLCVLVFTCASMDAVNNVDSTGDYDIGAINDFNLTYFEPACCNGTDSDCPNQTDPFNPVFCKHRYFGFYGSAFTCREDANGGPDCTDYKYGLADDDGSSDGAAVSWAGTWSINYQAAEADFYWPDGTCPMKSTWYFQPGMPTQQSGSPPLTPAWTGSYYLAWKYPNAIPSSCHPANNYLAGFAVAMDGYQGHYHSENTYMTGDYTHAYGYTSWSWSFGCSSSAACSISASPSGQTSVSDNPAQPVNYDY